MRCRQAARKLCWPLTDKCPPITPNQLHSACHCLSSQATPATVHICIVCAMFVPKQLGKGLHNKPKLLSRLAWFNKIMCRRGLGSCCPRTYNYYTHICVCTWKHMSIWYTMHMHTHKKYAHVDIHVQESEHTHAPSHEHTHWIGTRCVQVCPLPLQSAQHAAARSRG